MIDEEPVAKLNGGVLQLAMKLKLSVTGESGKGDYVADVLHACRKEDKPFEAEAKPCMRHRAVLLTSADIWHVA